MVNSDMMWFCINCKEKVEKNIITDMKIEERCNAIMKEYEQRMSLIESSLAQKCSESEVRNIVREELNTNPEIISNKTKSGENIVQEPEGTGVNKVMVEINERKQRERNLIVFGAHESSSDSREERIQHDSVMIKDICTACEVMIEDIDITKIVRIGKFNKDKTDRPMLITLKSQETKRNIFKGAKHMRGMPEFTDIRLSNDLTRTERDQEKILYDEAKELESKESGNFIFRVRGPPWARKVVRIRKEDN